MSAPGQPTQNQAGALVSLHGQGFGGQLYVATPALLKAFGISASEVNPAADVLTVRAGLPSTGGLALVSGSFLAAVAARVPRRAVHPEPGHPGGRQAAGRHRPCRTP